jgi:predicted nucleic acid-binding protein
LRIYIDTSFLISLYSADSNSKTAAALMTESADEHVISTFGELEAINALQLRVFRKEISPQQAKASRDDLAKDLRSGVVRLVALPDLAFKRAQALSEKTTARLGTRTADLLHVAAALETEADCLYSFDQQQRRLARAVRLTINP